MNITTIAIIFIIADFKFLSMLFFNFNLHFCRFGVFPFYFGK